MAASVFQLTDAESSALLATYSPQPRAWVNVKELVCVSVLAQGPSYAPTAWRCTLSFAYASGPVSASFSIDFSTESEAIAYAETWTQRLENAK